MSLRNFAAAALGDLSEVLVATGNVAVTASDRHPGEYVYRCYPSGAGLGSFTFKGLAADGRAADLNAATLWAMLAVRVVTAPTATEPLLVIEHVLGAKLKVLLRSDLALELRDGADNVLGTSNRALMLGQWHWLAASAGTESLGGDGTWELQLDGAGTGLKGSSGATGTFSARQVVVGKGANLSGSGYDVRIGEVILDDADKWPPGSRVRRLAVVADGTYTAWAGTAPEWEQLAEVPHDGALTQLTSSKSGDRQTVRCAGPEAQGLAVAQAVMAAIVFKDSSVRVLVRSGETDVTTDASTSSQFALRRKLMTADPATGAAWTLGGVAGVEAGAQNQNNATCALTLVALLVLGRLAAREHAVGHGVGAGILRGVL